MYAHLKRLMDIVLSFWGIVVFFLPMLVIGFLIRVTSPGPALFRQTRIKIHKQTFSCLKFRTMRIDTPSETPTHLLATPDRFITPIGRFLRRFSLDELPQLFNILVGDMSFIGPRPALWNQEDLITLRDQYGANDIRPGLTGYAQINGRDRLDIETKARLDGDYVKRMGFGFDCRCFFGTVLSVLRHDGVVEGGTGASLDKDKDKVGIT